MKSLSAPRQRPVAGFTLIELMAAMAVFTILLVMLLRVFSGSVKAFNAGAGLSKQTTEARLVLEHVAGMMEDHYFDLGPPSQVIFKDEACRDMASIQLSAVAAGAGSDSDTTTLVQQDIAGGGAPIPMLDHVIGFEVNVFTEALLPGAGATPSMTGLATYSHPGPVAGGCTNSPILAVIYLETLDDQTARINKAAGAAYDEGLKSQKYYRTVYLRNFLSN